MAGNKSWTIQAIANEGAAVAFYRQGEALFVGGARAAAISPVEHLLVATAGCLALSCRAVLTDSRKSASSVEVIAIGTKAAEPPSRLGRIDLAVRFGSEIDPIEARSIVEKAEKLCTVTNTLLAYVAIEIDSSSARHDMAPIGA
jgi:uncharacterized OsmC-like protein